MNLAVELTMWMAMETFKFFGLSFPSVHAIYAALGNRKFDLRPKWKLRVTTIYIRKYGLGFSPPLFLNGSQTCDALFRLPRSTNFCLRYTSLSLCVQCKHIIYSFLEARFSRFTLESRIGHPHSVVHDCTMCPQSILLQWHSYWGSFLFQQLFFSLGGLYARQARAHLTNKETENWVPVKLAQYMNHKDQRISL